MNERGGFWITTDIYLKKDTENAIAGENFYEEQGAKFLEDHHVEEKNKFESFETQNNFLRNVALRSLKK